MLFSLAHLMEKKKKRKKESRKKECIFKPEILLGSLLAFQIIPQAYKLDFSGS